MGRNEKEDVFIESLEGSSGEITEEENLNIGIDPVFCRLTCFLICYFTRFL